MRVPEGRRTRFGLLLAAVVAITLSACRPSKAAEGELLVGAASSLRELLTATAPGFEAAHPGTTLRFSFEASSSVARQIDAGADFDVFLSADQPTIARVADRLVAPGTPVLAGDLVLVARPGLETTVAGPEQLAASDASLVLAAAAVPAGRYARAYLSEQGWLEALEPRAVSADHVRAALALVEKGVVDYGFVYATDARQAERARTVWTAPRAEGPQVTYVAGVVDGGATELAQDYVDWLRGAAFQHVANEHGFRTPRG